jgi:hypothetical protein
MASPTTPIPSSVPWCGLPVPRSAT